MREQQQLERQPEAEQQPEAEPQNQRSRAADLGSSIDYLLSHHVIKKGSIAESAY